MSDLKAGLYNHRKIDFLEEPMFFGSGKNTQRFDIMKYEWYDKSNKIQQGHDWSWDEITIKNDISDHEYKLTEGMKHITKVGLQRAIFLDSLNGRSPILMFGQVCNQPEVEAAITTWTHFEVNKHSRTYTKHLRALYKDPAAIFDESFTTPELSKNTKVISGIFDECYFEVIGWIYKQQRNIPMSKEELDLVYEKFLLAWIEVNILEGIRFYPFFSSIWGMHHSEKVMEELTSDLIFIARDENEHLKFSQYTINLLKKKLGEGFVETFKRLTPIIKERYYQVFQEEYEWIDFTYSKGSYLGMNANIAKDYINYLIVRRMESIGLNVDENALGGKIIRNHPIQWVEWYINNDKEEKLPQQQYILNYIVNAVENDVKDVKALPFLNKLIRIDNKKEQ